jgi:hypothetical protein
VDGLAGLLDGELRRFVDRLGGWNAARWNARTSSPPGLDATAPVRGEVARHLIQRLADLAADMEDRPRRTVPVLEAENGYADQIMVLGHDLVVYGGDSPRRDKLLAAGLAEVLLHRFEIDGSEPAAGPAKAALAVLGDADVHGMDEVLAVFAAHCPGRSWGMHDDEYPGE